MFYYFNVKHVETALLSIKRNVKFDYRNIQPPIIAI